MYNSTLLPGSPGLLLHSSGAEFDVPFTPIRYRRKPLLEVKRIGSPLGYSIRSTLSLFPRRSMGLFP